MQLATKPDVQDLYQLPTDLYVPEHALVVHLSNFQGPLDLLLYLIKRQRLDILALPMADLTMQYMHYLDMMKTLDLEPAVEYLAMAAWLTEIKSQTLLPKPKTIDEQEIDPRAQLVTRLQEYERYQVASEKLEQLPRLGRDFFQACVDIHPQTLATVVDITQVTQLELEALVKVMENMLQRMSHFSHHCVWRPMLSVQDKIDALCTQLSQGQPRLFTELLIADELRAGVVVTFLAILELARRGTLVLSVLIDREDILITLDQG